MKNINSSVLPHVLEVLNRRPGLCDTFDNLCEEIAEYFIEENGDAETSDIRKALKRALNAGNHLGLVAMTNNIVRMPFKLSTEEQNVPITVLNDESDSLDEIVEHEDENATTSRRKSVKPRKHNNSTPGEFEFYMESPRRRVPSSILRKDPAERRKRNSSKVRRGQRTSRRSRRVIKRRR